MGLAHLGFGLAWLGLLGWVIVLLTARPQRASWWEGALLIGGGTLILIGLVLLFGGDTISLLWAQRSPGRL